MFFERFVYHEFGFQLKNPGRFLHAALIFGSTGGFILLAARRFFRRRLLAAAISGLRTFLNGAGVVDGKNGNGRLAEAIAVNLMYAHPDRSGQQCGYPKPGERFYCAGRHYNIGGVVSGKKTGIPLPIPCCKNIPKRSERQNTLRSLNAICKDVRGRKKRKPGSEKGVAAFFRGP